MKKTGLIIPFLKILVTKPSVILKSLFHTTINYEKKQFVGRNYNMEKGLPVINILDIFPGFKESIEPYTFLNHTSLPIDIAVLKMLARKFNGNCEYLEIGIWRGESIASMASVCKHCTSLSLSTDELRTLGYSEKMIKVERFFAKNIPNATNFEGNSLTFDYNKIGKKFDLIFVDGDHSFEGVKTDTQNVFNLLRDETSIIVWHDYVFQYDNIDWKVFAGILAGTPADKRKKLYHISNTLFAIYINGDFKTSALEDLFIPNKKFKVTIEGEKL